MPSGRGDQRADQQRNARNGQGPWRHRPFLPCFSVATTVDCGGTLRAINGVFASAFRLVDVPPLVHAAELGLVNGPAVRSGRGAEVWVNWDVRCWARSSKSAILPLFHQLIHDDKGDADRPHPDAKRDDDGPPGGTGTACLPGGGTGGILVLVAAVTAAVGVAGVCVARPSS